MYKLSVDYYLKNPYKPNGYAARISVELPVDVAAAEASGAPTVEREILAIYRAEVLFLEHQLDSFWGNPSADRCYRRHYVELSADSWILLQEQVDGKILEIETTLQEIVRSNRSEMFLEIPPKLERLIDPIMERPVPADEAPASATDVIDTTTCNTTHRLKIWRNGLKRGDYVDIWTDDLGGFNRYRIDQINKNCGTTYFFIKFNPLSGVIDKVLIDLIFPINNLF